ncbi:MAG: hypothetical protein KGJ45_12030 [Elusimicrobia bacterium]|nr:hypothetical protein [Elusimicrobiota bacterium]
MIGSRDLARENKKFRRSSLVMKKIKLPQHMKTKKCSKQLKGQNCFAANHTVIVGKEVLHLCQRHFEQMNLKNTKFERIEFLKASKL